MSRDGIPDARQKLSVEGVHKPSSMNRVVLIMNHEP